MNTNTTQPAGIDAMLTTFRGLADEMRAARGESLPDWQWIGRHMSQRMFGISRERAEEYAARYGGEARRMPEVLSPDESRAIWPR